MNATPRWPRLTRQLWAPLALLVTATLPADSLRSPLKGELVPEGPSVVLGLDELAQVQLPTGKFTRALEIEIAIPREVFPYRSNLAVFIYRNFVASKTGQGGTGERIGIEVLPPAGKFYLQAPLVARAGLKAAIDTAVLKLPNLEGAFPLAICVLPIDKDLPPGWEKFQFSIRTRLLHSNLGGVNLITPSLSEDDRKRLRIRANGVDQPVEGPLLLEPGPYNLEVSLPGADTVSVTVVVTQAKTIDVPVDLVVEEPTVVIEAPEGTQVVIDGKRLAWKASTPYPIEKGTHSIQFVLGNTVVADTFTVEKGGRHRLTLSLAFSFARE